MLLSRLLARARALWHHLPQEVAPDEPAPARHQNPPQRASLRLRDTRTVFKHRRQTASSTGHPGAG